MEKENFNGKKILVMGLGLHGGGLEAVRYLAKQGAEITATDLRDEKTLLPTLEKLQDIPVKYVLGRHEIKDFETADIVIKNPGVRPDSPYLKAARRIETDISLFLAACPAEILAVTGTKGKSSASSALYWVLKRFYDAHQPNRTAALGGNIGISPLSFLDKLKENDTAVLELSSFQLGDLRGRNILKPRAAVLTTMMRDHLDRYGTMEVYMADKRLIYQNQDSSDVTVAENDEWGKSFHKESKGRPLVFSGNPLPDGICGGWISASEGCGFARINGSTVKIVPADTLVPGKHQKKNFLAASLALLDLGIPPDFIRESLKLYPGIEHRLEFFHEHNGIKFYNDSAATIPEAAAAAINAFEKPLLLVTGGTDKELDFAPLAKAASKVKELVLLAGTGTEKLKKLLDNDGVKYRGPFDSLDAAISAVLEKAASGDNVILSPGCASFGMFLNEFDRGRQWKEGVKKSTNCANNPE